MKTIQKTKTSVFFPLILMVGLTACTTTYNLRYIRVEMMEPPPLYLSEGMDTIALFNLYQLQSDTIAYKYHDVAKHSDVYDSLIQYRYLSNKCLDALANSLDNEPYFLKVINYSDTAVNPLMGNAELHHKTGADICVFLDSFSFNDRLISSHANNLGIDIFLAFPEFKRSTRLESIQPSLIWIISLKDKTDLKVLKQNEKLYYADNLYPELFGSNEKHRLLLQEAAEYLGKEFTSSLIPSWQPVDRAYYRSNNKNMLLAEQYLHAGEWIKAAEIYNRLTSNKNLNIVAKATYNMALICEIEGNMDAANDWLNRSLSTYIRQNPRHLGHCHVYGILLANRIREIDRLEQQIDKIKSPNEPIDK